MMQGIQPARSPDQRETQKSNRHSGARRSNALCSIGSSNNSRPVFGYCWSNKEKRIVSNGLNPNIATSDKKTKMAWRVKLRRRRRKRNEIDNDNDNDSDDETSLKNSPSMPADENGLLHSMTTTTTFEDSMPSYSINNLLLFDIEEDTDYDNIGDHLNRVKATSIISPDSDVPSFASSSSSSSASQNLYISYPHPGTRPPTPRPRSGDLALAAAKKKRLKEEEIKTMLRRLSDSSLEQREQQRYEQQQHHHHQQQQGGGGAPYYDKLQPAIFEMNTKPKQHNFGRVLNETLHDKIARKDKLIQEQLKVIEELTNRVEVLSRQSSPLDSYDGDDEQDNEFPLKQHNVKKNIIDDQRKTVKELYINPQQFHQDDLRRMLVSFEPFFTTSSIISEGTDNVSPLTADGGDFFPSKDHQQDEDEY